MGNTIYQIDNLARHPGHADAFVSLVRQAWPPFLYHATDAHWRLLTQHFAEWQLLLQSGGNLIGAAIALPIFWNLTADDLPATREEILIRAIGQRELHKPANTLVVLMSGTAEGFSANGATPNVLEALKRLASEKGFVAVVMPVRPAYKSEYPLISFSQYVHWRRSDGSYFDPVLRSHSDWGGSPVGIMSRALVVEGDVAEWEQWSGMHFAQSGEYIVDDALRPVIIDCENNRGYYEEANLWMLHRI